MNMFQAAKQVTASDAARKLGLRESHGRFQCPFHDDQHPSMACYERDGRFYCFACNARGDAVDLWARVQRMSLRAAAEDLCRAYGLAYDQDTPRSRAAAQEEKQRKQRIEDIALLPQAVWQDWQRGTIAVLEEEFNACARLFDGYPDPEGWLWQFALKRATRVQDEINRLKAIEAKDLAAEVAERRAGEQQGADQPVVDEQLLRDILADRLRHTGIRLDAEERKFVYRTLQISPEG